MSARSQEEKLKDVLATCEVHWAMNRIPENKVLEMSHELEQHLGEALRDGKSIETVIGPDEFAFAESWAEEIRPPTSFTKRAVEFAYVFCVMGVFVTALYHLASWTSVVPLRWFEVSIVLINSVCFSRATIKPPPREEPRWKRWLVVGVVALASVTLIHGLSVVTLGSGNAVLIKWPWYATLLLAGAAVILSKLRNAADPHEERNHA